MSDSKLEVDLKGDSVQTAEAKKKKKKKKKNAFLASISLDDEPAKTSSPQNSNSSKSGNKTQTTTTTNPLAGIDPADYKAFLAQMGQKVFSGMLSESPLSIPKSTMPKPTVPTGKNTTQLPKGYSSNTPLKINDTPGDSFEVPEGVSRIFTSIPLKPKNANLKNNPEGWCEVVLDKPKLKMVIWTTCPDFPLPIPQPPKPLQCLKPSSISGIGMFATADLKMNDLILAERPLLITPAAIPCRIEIANDKTLTQEQKILMSIKEEEKSFEYVLGRMLPEAQAAYKSLANTHLDDGSGPLLGIARTNGFGMTFEDGGDPYSATYDKFSRINHSCLPNACIRFNRKSFCGELRAIRPIKAGQEIFYCYCEMNDPRAERQSFLKKYGFTCTCELCSSPELEEFRRRVIFSVRKLAPFLDPNMPDSKPKRDFELMAPECVSWLKQMEERGFQGSGAYAKHLQVAVTCFDRLRNQKEAIRWGTTWFQLAEALSGANGVMNVMVIMGAMAPSTLRLLQSQAK